MKASDNPTGQQQVPHQFSLTENFPAPRAAGPVLQSFVLGSRVSRGDGCLACGSIDPPDVALVETEYSSLPALPLKIGKQIVPGSQELATIVTKDPVVRTGVGRNPH